LVLTGLCIEKLAFETDERFRFGEDQKTLDLSQYSLELSLAMSNYSFFHNLIHLPLVILNLRRALSSKSSYFKPRLNAKQLVRGLLLPLNRSFLPLMMMILLQHFAIATSLHNLSILMSLVTVNLILLLMNLDTTLLVAVLQVNIV
jgi:hypothetical protein